MATEIEAYGREYRDRAPLATLYVGGGTPSLLPLDELAEILDAVHAHFDTSRLAELTVEANPEDVTPEWARAVRSMGATRVSLGVQSFFDDDLAFMTRNHTGDEAAAAVEALAAVFDSFSVDLIFGVPQQPFEIWGANLERAVRLGAPHISAYSLTVEPKTPLQRQVELGTVLPADDDEMRERFVFTSRYLAERGLAHYEVSSFARPGHESRHNSLYWDHSDVLAVGPAAHSFVRDTRSRAWRWHNVAHLGRWQGLLGAGHLPVDTRERLDADTLADEAVLLGLRRLDTGLDLDRLARDYGLDLLADKAAELAALERAGLLRVEPPRVRLTLAGAAVADAVAVRLAS